ncbi:alpha/beta hydrolase [Aeromicrobium panaciterrae]|uniref:alpha/beta fold hydrolase n=1 Tax=Aeromicrobium panaciterrae TaxID=363861 RepID=UPI0031DDC406
MASVTSADGTRIAYDDLGDGPAVIVLAGATCTRGVTRPLADALAARCRVINVDRRGRGESDDASQHPPYLVEREVEDIAALIEAVGGHASLYGHSSGAALAMNAAARGLSIDRVVMHDAPYNLAGGEQAGVDWHARLHTLLAEDRPSDAMVEFMKLVGVPEQVVTGMQQGLGWATMTEVAPTLAYDSAAMGDEHGGVVPIDLLARVTAPTLVLVGGADHGFMIDVARQLVEALPNGALDHMVGAGHDVAGDIVAERIAPFLTT